MFHLILFATEQAALNAATKSISVDLQADGIMAVCFHPGRLRPEMGGSDNGTQLDIDTSARYILTTLDSLNEKHNGCFLQYDGKSLPW
jgi:NAD(P)-dependent dehydrogenase (short-subunit alcohol dehydrogenase family)